MSIGSPDVVTRNSRSVLDADRRNYGKRLWVDDAEPATRPDPTRLTEEINEDKVGAERLRESRRQAREGRIVWREEGHTE